MHQGCQVILYLFQTCIFICYLILQLLLFSVTWLLCHYFFYCFFSQSQILSGKVQPRSGCPLSPYLFILSTEILRAAVRRDKLIHGIQNLDNKCKISQYAYDTMLILDGTKSSIERSFLLRNIFPKLSGIKVNYEKTEALWIGSFKN